MKELSLHVLDIVQNSTAAGATIVEIRIIEDIRNDMMTIEIKDNGRGIDEHTLRKIYDPFYTTRTTRKVGLGIPLFRQAAMSCGGDFSISSKVGEGTTTKASFIRSHIDRAPLGNMADTMVSLITANHEVNFIYIHQVGDKKNVFDTRDIKETLQDVPIYHPLVLDWIKRYIEEWFKE